jgi:hypothetical protein
MSKRVVVAMIATIVAAGLAVVGTGAVTAAAIGHAPSMRVPAGIIWTSLIPAKGVQFPS